MWARPGLARLAKTSYGSRWVPSYPWPGITAFLLNAKFSITLTYKILCLKFSSSGSAEYDAEYDQDSHNLHFEEPPSSRIYPWYTGHMWQSMTWPWPWQIVTMHCTGQQSDIGIHEPCLCLLFFKTPFWLRWELPMEHSLVNFHSTHTKNNEKFLQKFD